MNRIKAITLLSGALFLGACGQTQPTPTAAAPSAGQTASTLGITPDTKTSPTGRWFVELEGEPDGLSAQSLSAQQQSFRLQAQSAGIEFQEVASYQTLFNGFSVEVSDAEVAKFTHLPGVKAVYPVGLVAQPQLERGSLEPQMFTANDMTGATTAHEDLGLTGKGVKVGIIDSGIDNEHPAFAGRIAQQYDFVGDDFDSAGANGNIIPQPDNNADDCGGHGSHVAGIVGGNDPATGFKGVAPDVTFGAYRVFGCKGSTSEDIMLQAMERAAADGMDVVNMSIGSSFQWAEYPTAKAADRLVKRGIVLTVSAGNSGTSGQFATGAPSLAEKAISVAAVGNTTISLNTISYSVNGAASGKIGFMKASPSADPKEGVTYELAVAQPLNACNVSGANPFKAGQFTGKAVLLQRGGCTFAEKASNAAAAGATAVVIFNNSVGYLPPSLGSQGVNIPAILISKDDGTKLKTDIEAGRKVTFSFNPSTERVETANPEANVITDFSSYGSGPDLELKPEIAAPGGNILSAAPLNKNPGGYVVNSGTSMAAPHVAGAAALLLQGHPTWTPEEVKTHMMNTATSRFIKDQVTYTQLQGAGMVDIPAAHFSTVTASPAKLSLGASSLGATRSKVVVLRNYGDAAQTFTVTHRPALTLGGTTAKPKADDKNFATMTVNGQSVDVDARGAGGIQITVPAGGTTELNVSITAPAGAQEAAQYGGFLVARSDKQTVSVPYGGFKGNYQALCVLGNVIFEEDGEDTERKFPALYDALEDRVYFNGDLPAKAPDFTFANYERVFGLRTLNIFDAPTIWVNFAHQAQDVVLEAVNVNNQVHAIAHYPFWGRSGKDIYVVGDTSRPWDNFVWNGKFADGTEAPASEYRLRVRVLKALGNPDNAAHWETYESPAFNVIRAPKN